MEKNYNYTRGKLHLPEYGRHIQNMVNSLKDIEDREERNKQAQAVIAVMGNLNPLLRDTADYTHKLWDHLFIISGFDLDVDSPYPVPTRDEVEVKPKKLEYSQQNIRFKHYGKHIAKMIEALGKESDAEAVARAVDNIARYMRSKSFEYNQEHPNNELIIKDIRKMSNYGIEIDEDAINNLRSSYKNNQTTHSAKSNKGATNKHNARNHAKPNNGQRRGTNNNRQNTQN
ncbi:MAG: DUF4290 domain-containing protein [Rikenellaceae bacterium]